VEPDGNTLIGVAVRSCSQHSTFAASNVSLSTTGDNINNSTHELLTFQTGLTIQYLSKHNYLILTNGSLFVDY